MATRIISAYNTSENITQSDGDSYTFSGNLTSDTPVSNGTVTGISINFDRMRHFSNDYYLVVYVGGVRIGETDRIYGNRDYYTTVSHTMDFDTEDYSSKYFANALTATGSITVKAYENGSADESFNIRSGCTCTIYVYYDAPSLSAPGKPTVTQEGTNYKISWSPASISGGGSGNILYDVLVDGDVYMWSAGTATSLTHAIPSEYYGVSASFSVRATCDSLSLEPSYSLSTSFTAQVPYPTITSQPTITSMNPTSGQSTTITWSAASVSNQGSATIYYQYFVGPSSTYSDSYHISTTTGLTATITEANILDKCGSDFDGTCYIFVRAYWQAADGTTGGWSTPTGKAFTYTPHRTIKYFNGSSWVECIPYYFNGSSWVECIPYYFNGSSWIECSH